MSNLRIQTLKRKVSDQARHVQALRETVQSLQSRLEKATRELAEAEPELRAYREALYIVSPESKGKFDIQTADPAFNWDSLMSELKQAEDGFTYDDILLIAEASNFPITRGSLRTRMHRMVQEGHAIRLDDGKFRIISDQQSTNS